MIAIGKRLPTKGPSPGPPPDIFGAVAAVDHRGLAEKCHRKSARERRQPVERVAEQTDSLALFQAPEKNQLAYRPRLKRRAPFFPALPQIRRQDVLLHV
jgi:hypothetical protein